ncbi:MAG: glycosyltransferase family 39 protein, partial [Anaerolineae bacterium]|nr:glycosyltransferase family 39 protein [Anaerolineae bacterium]
MPSHGKATLQPTITIWIKLSLALLVLVGFVIFANRYVGHVLTIRNVDYFQFVEMGRASKIGGIEAWVHGLHPIGYPLLIRLGIALGFNATQTGHTLSIIGGIFLLISTYALTYRLTQDYWLSFFSELFLATTSLFLFYATLEGNDILSAGLIGISLVLLLNHPKHWYVYWAAGLLAGLSYLIRYTAIATSAICLLYLIGLAILSKYRENWKYVAAFAGGWVVGAALQLIPSLLVTGNPFYSIQGHNVWWHMAGLSNFATEWGLAPMNISLLEVFRADPWHFLDHWWRVFRSFWLSPDLLLLDTPLRLFT